MYLTLFKQFYQLNRNLYLYDIGPYPDWSSGLLDGWMNDSAAGALFWADAGLHSV